MYLYRRFAGKSQARNIETYRKNQTHMAKKQIFCTLALERRSCLYSRHQPQRFPVTNNGYAAVVMTDKFFAGLNSSNIFITRRHKAICP
jgi:predicted branched-subunit amino acid permease